MRWADNVVEESTTTTTLAYQLGGVPASGEAPGAQTFVAGIGDAQTCYYYAKEVSGTAWERGIGTVTDAATDTLTRTTIHGSSNAGAAVDWTGKTLRVYCVNSAYALRRSTLDHAGLLDNIGIATSRSGNAETISLKTAAGNDPSAADPVRLSFQDGAGGFAAIDVTAAASIVVSSGSTLGATSATIFRLWLVGFNDAGTFRLGVIKCALTDGVYGLQDNVLESSTAEGGAGAADSSGVIYTGTAVTSKAMRVLGYLEYTLTTAGTWDAAPSLINIYSQGDRLPGERIQVRRNSTGAVATGTTMIPVDDTIPQNTEGTQFMTQDIIPKSAANYLVIQHTGEYANSTAGATTVVAIFQDSSANALAAHMVTEPAASYSIILAVKHAMVSGTASSTTFKIRVGAGSAGTITFNGAVGARYLGGVFASHLEITEIMV
ncbi:MAG: hypothetical protein IPK48_06985 [Gammaproteobacteria bacterium]|nr:hypothetical protein [Gammaproteobacteria bacterium]